MDNNYTNKNNQAPFAENNATNLNNYSKILDNLPLLIWLKDKQGRYNYINKLFVDFWKIAPEQILGKANNEFFANSNLFKLCDDSEVLINGHRLTENKSLTLQGETKWFEVSRCPIFDDKGDIVGVSSAARDITEKKRIEDILFDSEEKFRQFAENTFDAFILRNGNDVLYANKAFEKVYGRVITEAYLNTDIPINWVYLDDIAKVQELKSDENWKNINLQLQYRIVHDNGNIRWVWERNFPVFDELNRPIRHITVTSDITEQKELENKLQQSRAQQQAILDNIPHMAWLKDKYGRYTSANESFAQYFKMSNIDIIGKTDFDLCPNELATQYADNDDKVLRTGMQQQFEEVVNTLEGVIYTETFKTPITDLNNNIVGITGISRNITSYKKLEQKLRDNDERLRALLRYSSDAITIIDNMGNIVFESFLLTKLTGYTIDELKQILFINLVHPDDKAMVLETLNICLQQPNNQQIIEFRCLRKDGTEMYIESIITNQFEIPQIQGIVINSRDITERKLAEIKENEYQDNLKILESTALEFLSLTRSEDIYKFIGEKIHGLVPNSAVIYCSYGADDNCLQIRNITGVDKYLPILAQTLGSNLLEYKIYLTRQFKDKVFVYSNRLFEIEGGIYTLVNGQLPMLVCKATERLISLNKIYGMGIVRNNQLLGAVLIITRFKNDIVNKSIIDTLIYQASIALLRRKLEKELIIAKEKAEESDKLKSSFLANMSHEIRTPVNGIIGFSQLLHDNGLTQEKRKEFVEIIRHNADSLIALIDDILDISIIEEGQVKIRKQLMNINLLLNEVYDTFNTEKYLGSDNKIRLVCSGNLPDEHATLFSDSLRIKQILNNLICNAFKFTNEGEILFGYEFEEAYIKFFVKDSGIGINPEKQEIIFRRFVQAESTMHRRYGGSGLGLAISKGLLDLLGGQIWVKSEESKGSEFYFTIPIDKTALKVDK